MPYEPLTDEQIEIRDLIRDLSRERVAPRAAEIDKSAEFPWDVVELFREHELFGLMFDEEYGGAGASALMTLVAIEEVSKVCATSGLILAVQELGSLGIKLAGNDEQRQRFLPKLASGEWLPAYALTEPGSGSVFANTTYTDATPAFVMKRLPPFRIHSSPSRRAVERIAAESDPEPGSVSA